MIIRNDLMKPKHIILLAADAASIVFFVCTTIIALVLAGSLPDQQTAERWGGKERYSQVSMFTDYDNGLTIDSIFMARTDIEKKLVENSLPVEAYGARVWVDAFSSYDLAMPVASDRASAESAAIITGGDFFLFHPQDIISGYYYSESDTMYDRIVIDDVLAWQLFGASDVVGMPVTIGGKYFYVAGVFKRSENSDIEKVYGEKPRLFMPYQGYSLISPDEGIKFSCYEACLPDPVTGLGKQIVSESFSVKDENRRIVENSVRYRLKNRFSLIADNGMRSVVDIPLVYPYWENAARMTEDRSAALLVMQIIGLAAPVFTLVYLFRLLIKNRKKIFEKVRDGAVGAYRKTSEKIKENKKVNADKKQDNTVKN